MLRSMYSGISGMKVNQTKLDVIGNNISNVGTTSFKASRARFSDMLSQNVSDAMAPSTSAGGRNASQVGMGVQLASIDSVMTQGMMQPTGRALDVGIDGDGFFMVSKGPALYGDTLQVNHRPGQHTITDQSLAASGSEIMYSRDGSFILDQEGNLLTGDGFRVLGYSLTNDDSSQPATGQTPNPVNTAGLDFRFGPGSQLNGYKVVLGAVGPGTVTTADVNKAEKIVVVNGDFSTPGALTAQQIENAVNKGLSSAGISQQIFVSGKPVNIADLASEGVKGGADATAPKAIAIGGFTLQLSEGSALNGYSFEISDVGVGTSLQAEVKPDTKKIVIQGDFITKGAITAQGLKDAINGALSDQKIEMQVTNVTGAPMNLSNITGKLDTSGKDAKAPTMKDEVIKGDDTVLGNDKENAFHSNNIEMNLGGTAALNGYSIFMESTDNNTGVTVDREGPSIKINIKKGETDQAAVQKAIEDALKNEFKNGEITVNIKNLDNIQTALASDNKVKITLSGGSDLTAPKSTNLGGFTINSPKGEMFNGLGFEISDVKGENGLDVTFDGTKFVVKGNFVDPGAISSSDLDKAINDAIKKYNEDNKNVTDFKAFPVDDKNKFTVTGSSKVYTGLTSSQVEGGEDLKAPVGTEAAGMEFEFTPGGALNGYTIQIGKISAGTKSNATIDEKNKTIIIDADLVSDNGASAQSIQNALNKALQDKGINQGIKVTGTPLQIGGVESGITLGGTPVESMNEDGSLNFVDGTKDLKSYDGELVTLKIPDKVRVPGTDQELRVKSYTIDKSGVINGVLEDGRVAALGQIAMASFKNPEGLTKNGGNLYSASVNSGDAVIKSGVGTLGEDNSKGYGDNLQGMLEMSNVDLAEQFTDMIVSSRAFQAAGKMITTGDEILQDIINLKR